MSPAPGTPAIEATGLHKSFGVAPVLRGLDLRVEWGRVLVVFGANGSGKTTLLRLLAAQYRPDRGRVVVGGIDRSRDPSSIRRMIGVVAHQPMLYQDLTCRENLTFFGRMRGLNDLPRRVDEALRRVGLEARRHRRARALSHGMQKRLALGVATLHDPPVLLLDEPASGLDQEALAGLRGMFSSASGGRRAVVMVTHNLERGLEWADEVAVLSGGVIAYKAEREGLDEGRFEEAYRGGLR